MIPKVIEIIRGLFTMELRFRIKDFRFGKIWI